MDRKLFSGSLIVLMLIPLITGFTREAGVKVRNSSPIGYINIIVESNTNRLYFKYNLSEGCLPVGNGLQPAGDREEASSVNLSIPVRDFQCANALVYYDFLNLLKATQYPLMKIVIPRESFYQLRKDNSPVLHGVIITIAGISRDYDIICTIDDRNDNSSILIGTVRIMLTDLEIDPPVKFLGLVKVKDEIIVNFGFCLEEQSPVISNI